MLLSLNRIEFPRWKNTLTNKWVPFRFTNVLFHKQNIDLVRINGSPHSQLLLSLLGLISSSSAELKIIIKWQETPVFN